jgi:two-component system, chemotaxis family, protein-glutamate methylesterase/glutaminase
MNDRIRVLVVDDSAFARKVLREVLDVPEIEVVGIAHDGLEALEQIETLKPDVITLDLVMPNLDGLGVLRMLPKAGAPRVVVVSISDGESELGVEALQAGAVTVVQKPTALATDQLYELGSELVRAVRMAAHARSPRLRNVPAVVPLPPRAHATARQLVVIGTSTGGPQALTQLLAELPQDFPLPIVIALHIPRGYTDELANRLNRQCAIEVVEASQGLALRPGLAILARGGEHLTIAPGRQDNFVQISSGYAAELHAPSVDVLFESAAARFGSGVLGVVLTGMGNDGLRGARAIAAAGGRVVTEAEESCVVYGMPGVVKEAGLSYAEAPLENMGALIVQQL